MTTAPFEPNPQPEEEIAAADPGRGAPRPAPGFGPTNVEPDQSAEPDTGDEADRDAR
ncbi:hypothetical protein [Saccharomonospora marina]|uniref:hypothetical protein n=1 Tax=Saccharomonospora marina TaxID=632569 RepID=UPI0002FA5AAE|nr:hypothetical protein [Saccharomonospora marina]